MSEFISRALRPHLGSAACACIECGREWSGEDGWAGAIDATGPGNRPGGLCPSCQAQIDLHIEQRDAPWTHDEAGRCWRRDRPELVVQRVARPGDEDQHCFVAVLFGDGEPSVFPRAFPHWYQAWETVNRWAEPPE